MEDKDLEIEIDQYLGEAKSFEETTPKEADELLEAKEGNIVYIGRETCPYCRRFVKTLGPLSKEHHLKIHYVHAQHPEYEQEVNELRDKYDVPTVPGLLYSSETAGMVVKCDSSLDAEEILKIVEATE